MEFGIFALSTVPGTLAERERLRPIGRNNERVQQMFEELRAIAIRADQSGFDAFATTEHHFHSEGLELSPSPFTLFSDNDTLLDIPEEPFRITFLDCC